MLQFEDIKIFGLFFGYTRTSVLPVIASYEGGDILARRERRDSLAAKR